MEKDTRTVCGNGGIPLLEIIKQKGMITIFEADDMDRQITFPAVLIPALISNLESFK